MVSNNWLKTRFLCTIRTRSAIRPATDNKWRRPMLLLTRTKQDVCLLSLSLSHTHHHHRLGALNWDSNWCILMRSPLVLPQIQIINVTPCWVTHTHTQVHSDRFVRLFKECRISCHGNSWHKWMRSGGKKLYVSRPFIHQPSATTLPHAFYNILQLNLSIKVKVWRHNVSELYY